MIFRAACATASAALQRQRGALLTFAPVFMGVGIGLFFSLAREPGLWGYGLALAGGLAALIVANALRHTLGPLFAAGPWIAFGFCVAGLHAHMSGGPVLDYRYYGVIEGRVVAIDRSFTDKIRLTLDRVYLERRQPYETPRRVRIALHAQDGLPLPAPGSHAILSGHLSPPPSPAEPRGFEFERHAWFQSLGAVGYTRSPALTFAPPESGPALVVFRLRMALSAAISARIGSDAGAVAAAVTTGDRSGMSRAILEDLRGANLAHLLAISGLHMGLLTGFVFGAVRFFLALIPHVALTWPTRRIAALAGLCAGAAYLALSGGSVATERAFIMVAVVFGAVLLGRRALTLRAVALAALIVLVLHPEALMGPGFQMSFAATTALVVAFRWLTQHDMFGAPRMIRPALAVLVSSAVAGAATAPFAAAHFNVVSHYGLLANLLSVPVMGALVMPAAVIAALAAPLGLEAAPLWVMEQGLRWILFVAQWVSSLEGAVGRLPSPPPAALPLFALGGLMLILWRGAARYGGGLALACAVFLWGTAERPDLLISPTGGLMG
ncbi:MAG: ComEC/Rec2 family competence protein, partial [Pseudomonadota bacterium]